jgi:hypothetical protein
MIFLEMTQVTPAITQFHLKPGLYGGRVPN